jgi:ribonuclease P protein component
VVTHQNYSFPKKARLLFRGQFREVMKFGQEYIGDCIIVHIKAKKNSSTKLGITVSKRFGKAHERNRFKRMVREAFRQSLPTLPSNLYIHIKPREEAKNFVFYKIQAELDQSIEAYLSPEPAGKT